MGSRLVSAGAVTNVPTLPDPVKPAQMQAQGGHPNRRGGIIKCPCWCGLNLVDLDPMHCDSDDFRCSWQCFALYRFDVVGALRRADAAILKYRAECIRARRREFP